MSVKDLTGQKFGALTVLRQSENWYISPDGKKRIPKWICRCNECGREKEMLPSSIRNAQNCGCRKPRPKHKKICVICGKEFECPPSDKTVTCSPECRSVRAAQALAERRAQGDTFCGPWTPEYRKQRAENEKIQAQLIHAQKIATQAAKQSPVAGRFETNHAAKVWALIDPEGNQYTVRNLELWARDNTCRFGKPPGDKSAQQISRGFEAIAQTLKGNRGAPGKRQRGSLSYFGWTLMCPPDAPGKNE